MAKVRKLVQIEVELDEEVWDKFVTLAVADKMKEVIGEYIRRHPFHVKEERSDQRELNRQYRELLDRSKKTDKRIADLVTKVEDIQGKLRKERGDSDFG